MLDIADTRHEGILVVAPMGRLDSATAGVLETWLMERIASGETHIVLDFDRLFYISSAGLRVVLMAGKRVKAAGGRLELCALAPPIREVFEISGFFKLFDVHATLDEALAAAR